MPSRKLLEKNIRKVQRSHGTYYVSIPKEIAKAMNLKERQKVVFDFDKKAKTIKIKDWLGRPKL